MTFKLGSIDYNFGNKKTYLTRGVRRTKNPLNIVNIRKKYLKQEEPFQINNFDYGLVDTKAAQNYERLQPSFELQQQKEAFFEKQKEAWQNMNEQVQKGNIDKYTFKQWEAQLKSRKIEEQKQALQDYAEIMKRNADEMGLKKLYYAQETRKEWEKLNKPEIERRKKEQLELSKMQTKLSIAQALEKGTLGESYIEAIGQRLSKTGNLSRQDKQLFEKRNEYEILFINQGLNPQEAHLKANRIIDAEIRAKTERKLKNLRTSKLPERLRRRNIDTKLKGTINEMSLI